MPQQRAITLAASIYVSLFCIAAVALLLRDACLRRGNRAGGPPGKPLTSRSTPRWLIWPLVALLVVSFGYLQTHPLPGAQRRPMPPIPLWVPMIPAVIVVAFVFLGVRKSLGSKAPESRRQRLWAAFALTVAVFAAVAAVIASRPGPPGAGVNRAMMSLAFVPLALLILGALLVLFVWIKSRDPVTNRAFARAREGDVDGALRDLLEVVESRGANGPRANAIGALAIEKGDYAKAFEWFGEAERLGYNAAVCRANRAVALRKMGRAAESCEILGDVALAKPDDPTLIAMYALALAECGRADEAREHYRRAKSLPQAFGQNRAHREGFEKLLNECRERLGESATDGAEGIGPGA